MFFIATHDVMCDMHGDKLAAKLNFGHFTCTACDCLGIVIDTYIYIYLFTYVCGRHRVVSLECCGFWCRLCFSSSALKSPPFFSCVSLLYFFLYEDMELKPLKELRLSQGQCKMKVSFAFHLLNRRNYVSHPLLPIAWRYRVMNISHRQISVAHTNKKKMCLSSTDFATEIANVQFVYPFTISRTAEDLQWEKEEIQRKSIYITYSFTEIFLEVLQQY